MVYKLFLPQCVQAEYKDWTHDMKHPMEFIEKYDSIRVQMSLWEEKTDDADGWEVSPLVIDDVEVSSNVCTQ